MALRRPPPNPPGPPTAAPHRANHAPPALDPFSMNNPYFAPYQYPAYAPQPEIRDEPATSTVPVGTFLHKGFYDLLAMIPTPSPSRLLWGAPPRSPEPEVAGPRYEDIKPPKGGAIKASPKKGRRISKDMVSKPTGFVYVCHCIAASHPHSLTVDARHLVHASDADQLEALLTRWGPDGLGKLGGQIESFHGSFPSLTRDY